MQSGRLKHVNIPEVASVRNASIFVFRQGLWTAGLRTPPGQECSNGSLTRFAVVPWRIFMKLVKVKTARFADVIDQCGEPESYTLWRSPKDDPQLKKLLASNHVMTIRNAGGADFGEVGLQERKGAMYLKFPKSLKRFEGKRIVGVKWDLVKA